MVFLTTILTLISFSDGESDQSAIIAIYILLALLCILNYIIPLFKNYKSKSKTAEVFTIQILVNIILVVLPAFFFIAMLNIDGSVGGLLIVTYILAIIAFLLYCSSVRAGYKAVEASERAVQQAVYETPTQAFAYDRQPNLVASSRSANATDEIKKYTELLDMGAITQEEFDANKKQLLGL